MSGPPYYPGQAMNPNLHRQEFLRRTGHVTEPNAQGLPHLSALSRQQPLLGGFSTGLTNPRLGALPAQQQLGYAPSALGLGIARTDEEHMLRMMMMRHHESDLQRQRETLQMAAAVAARPSMDLPLPGSRGIHASGAYPDLSLTSSAIAQQRAAVLSKQRQLEEEHLRTQEQLHAAASHHDASSNGLQDRPYSEVQRYYDEEAAASAVAALTGSTASAPRPAKKKKSQKQRKRTPSKNSKKSAAAASVEPTANAAGASTKKAAQSSNKPPAAMEPGVLNKKDAKWMSSYNQLIEYKKEYGDCIVPRGFAPDPRLASWVAEQRKQYKLLMDGKSSSITPFRVEKLKAIDFAWNAQGAAWDRHYEDLIKFKKEYGDCLVPLNHHRYPKLGLWIKEQRRHYALMKQGKPSHMTEERSSKLDAINFCWDTHEAVWEERLRELIAYKEEHGNCIVPTSYHKNVKLGTWVHHQRRQYKKYRDGSPCHITLERIRSLESIGFVWDPRGKSSGSRRSSSSSDDSDDSETESSVESARPKKRRKKRSY